MVNLEPEMSRNYPPGPSPANMGPNPGHHNAPMHPNRAHPSNHNSSRNMQRPGPAHHPGHHQPHGQRPAQPNRGAGHAQEQPLSDHFDCKVLESAHYPFCPDHSKYEHIAKIGQGTFGEVHKAKVRGTAQIVALKKVLTENEKEGFPITALREIKILQVLKHENIVRLIEICTTKASADNKFKSEFYLVFEFCEHDLAGLLSNAKVKFALSEQKKIMQQLLNGLYYIHKNFILHRDMKTANILVTKEGKLKLADFGLARAVAQTNSSAKYTNRVVTLWYRSPELLLGEKCYNKAIDMWGAGCIMAELWTKEPILKGSTEQHQLELIQNLCGPITTEVWPEVDKLELFNKIVQRAEQKRKVKERLGNYIKDANGLDLLDKLLTLDPKKRIDSDEALDHDFFWTEPLPSDLKLEAITSSNFEYTAARRNQFRQAARHQNTDQQHFDRVY